MPTEKLQSRFPRTMANLATAVVELPHVLIFDKSDLSRPFREVTVFEHGRIVRSMEPLPGWFQLIRK